MLSSWLPKAQKKKQIAQIEVEEFEGLRQPGAILDYFRNDHVWRSQKKQVLKLIHYERDQFFIFSILFLYPIEKAWTQLAMLTISST